MSLNCPQCRSERVQKYSLIHRRGISDVNITTVEAGSFFEASKSKGQTTSRLSQDCAPPKKATYIVPMIIVGLIVGFISSALQDHVILQNLICWPLFLAYPVLAFSYNRSTYREELARWNRRFLCLVCEHSFEVNHGAQAASDTLRAASPT